MFGMGTGVALVIFSPANCRNISLCEVSRLNRLSRHILRISSCRKRLRAACNYLACVESLRTETMFLRRVNSMIKPNGRLVLVSYVHYCTSTSSLSTWWSSRALHFPFGLGDLILGHASRLYAFSGYHNRTSLPSRAFGKTTGTQEVRPSRSSRTKDSPLQISYAHSR